MRLRDFLNELTVSRECQKELRHNIINALEPGALVLRKALKDKSNKEDIVISKRDAQILMNGLERLYKFLGSIKIEK